MDDIDSVKQRAARVELLLMDCDGVLTDGRIWILENQDDQKVFNTRDGLGLELFHRAGLRSGIISGRRSTAVERRARELNVSYLRQGCSSKASAFKEILAEANISELGVAYIGDDLNDIPLMRRAGFAVAVADAARDVRQFAHFITNTAGGNGAVREAVEFILKSKDCWDDLVNPYLDNP